MSTMVSQLMEMVPNLPSGSLDKYREKSTFQWKRMRLAIEQPDCLKIKMEVWSILEADPLFSPPPVSLSSEEEKRLTAKQLVKFLFSGLFDGIHTMAYQDRTRYLIIVNEATEMFNPNLSIKFALGVSLFANALLCLGTERHLPYYKDVWSGKILSCLAITELAHGSDTKRLKTTSTYDHSTQEFVINSPGIESAKCWVGNLGKQCTHALLFAQLVCEGVHHGLHGFIVPIRDPGTLLPFPGLTVGDVGEKSGLHGIDNGYIMFHNYRIPRENLLNRTGDINGHGFYETQFSDPQRILGAALECLSAGRVAIMHESCNSLSKAVVIAVRYAAQRLQFSDSNGIELPIIEYQTHQWKLFPYLAATYAIKAFVNKFTEQYTNCVVQSRDGQMNVNQASVMVSGVHAIVCCSKALITWICRDAIQESREACGGHGYHKAAGLGDLRNNHDPRVTFEGDNTVLLQRTTNWLLRQVSESDGDYSYFPMTCVQYLGNSEEILNRHFTGSSLEDIFSQSFISGTYEWLVCWLMKSTLECIELMKRHEDDKFKLKNLSQVFKGRTLALVFAESNILMYFWEQCCSADSDLQGVLKKLYYLYGTWSLYKHIAILYQGGFCKSPALADLLSAAILHLCGQLKVEAVSLADAIAPPDFILNSVLGSSDGKVYEKLMRAFKKYTGSSHRPYWWSEVIGKSKL